MAIAAIVVQTFVKIDTLKALCDSLLNCIHVDRFRLIFWCDNPKGSRKEELHATLQPEILKFIRDFSSRERHRFAGVEVHVNAENLGTCKTCEVAVDYAFIESEFVVFVEDDVVFARDALVWFTGIEQLGLLRRENLWAIAGESIFFDARNREVTPGLLESATALAKAAALVEAYTFHRWIPSTCFATTRDNWRQFSATRGQPTGDVDLCKRCETEEKLCIFPIVPRVKDVGMLHELGYSVMLHSRDAVMQNNKQTYLLSDMLAPEGSTNLRQFDGDGGLLFRQTTLLEAAI